MPIEIVSPPNFKTVDKLWGSEKWICNNQRYCGKLLYLKPGFRCSKHHHIIKAETFYVLEGKVRMEIGISGAIVLEAGAGVEILPFTLHRFQALDGPATVIEFSSPHREEDVVRWEPSGPVDDV